MIRNHVTRCIHWAILISILLAMPTIVLYGQESGSENTSETELPTTPLNNIEFLDNQWVIPFHLLGQGDAIRLTGQFAQAQIFLPVPKGMLPEQLIVHPIVSLDVISGFLEVRSEDRLLALFDLPTDETTLSIPLGDAIIKNDVIQLSFISRLRSVDDICETQLIGAWLDLEEPLYQLTAPGASVLPTTIADFFPPILTEVDIFMTEEPNLAEIEAALRVSAAITAMYPGQRPTVSIQTLPVAATVNQSEISWHQRQIIIQESDETEIMLDREGSGMPILYIKGTADDLSEQAQLLADQALVRAATVSRAAAAQLGNDQQNPGSRYEFSELGLDKRQVAGMGRIDLPFTLSQSDFGSVATITNIRLIGNYTPLQDGAQATLSLLFNDSLVRAIILNRSGQFDFSATIPQHIVKRDNELRLRIDYTPIDGLCRLGMQPITLELDGRSYIDIDHSQTLLAGFERFPQVFLDNFDVGLEVNSNDYVQSAAQLISELQRLTPKPLVPTVLDWEQALVTENSTLLIGSIPADSDLNPPFTTQGQDDILITVSGQEVELQFDLENSPAILQSFEEGDRDIIHLAPGNASTSPQSIPSYLSQNEDGWYTLSGDFMTESDAQITNGRIRDDRPPAVIETFQDRGISVRTIRMVAYAILVIFVLILLVWAYPKVVRREPNV